MIYYFSHIQFRLKFLCASQFGEVFRPGYGAGIFFLYPFSAVVAKKGHTTPSGGQIDRFSHVVGQSLKMQL